MLYDAHCHYSLLKKKYEGYFIAAVSMDYNSSVETLSLNDKNILKGVAIHPWNAHKEKIESVLPLIDKADFVGEIGLDYKYSEAPKELQIRYFEEFLKKSQDKTVNIHAVNSWNDVLNLLIKHDIRRAIIHWYSGPKELLRDIEGAGYFITINPSVTFQEKHRIIAENASPNIVLTESDGGYMYKGKLLEPTDIPSIIKFLSKIWNEDERYVEKKIEINFRKAFNL
ncbi:TatD family hydrolase [Acidianus hospitalis]|uniref:TatD family deoxyribonuclease n=2 Tax=Acidianus hospitalis TaxID=563177 RepID=A0A2T9X9U7_9CREN|nr:TatD family hydrolase [Acidianus hospitalis]AEE94142.1 TatD-related deoxyribonuclease [Acidianus hospitalis W1]PVU76859.1 TatD family deoxyribonuclease [Acidianus hospitalis]